MDHERRPVLPIRLEQVELEHLPRAPLRVALAQIKYPPTLAIEQPDRVAGFEQAISERFQLVHKQVMHPVQIEVSPSGVQRNEGAPETLWQFKEPDGSSTVALAATSLSFEAAEYQAFDSFEERLRFVIIAVAEAFRPREQTRLGLRYINEITDERLQHTGGVRHFINPELLSPVGSALGDDLIGGFAELRLRQPDGTFALRHGLNESGTYLLDFDYFTEEPREFNPVTIIEDIARFHDVIEAVFRWAITDEYLDELREQA